MPSPTALPRAAALLLLLPSAAAAQETPFRLVLPIDCVLGEECAVQNYVDADPGVEARDYACGPLSYDGHKGTDFRLPTIAQQAEGVEVRAAAAGVVLGLRDEMPDILQGWEGAPELDGRDCGNGVTIGHENGWETQYCHMAQGSIAVAVGQRVAAGDRLGEVGLSGQSQFPHLHFAVRRNDAVVDPFDPEDRVACGAAEQTLWETPPDYLPGGLLDAGFASGVPDYLDLQRGTAEQEVRSDAPLVLWGFVFGGRAGDVMHLVVEGPQGRVVDQEMPLEKTQAQLFRASGRRAPEGGWPIGTYEGQVTLLRDGAPLSERRATLSLEE
ncbi:M23 family metallopeptidase [Limimaricola litoreus]|uniref:M23 family metallopeptidase n=1 Tax=Limimaricola litoreus TaxID=2955316 RepID=A0A9X2FTJ5_9RHOB|nr:M23 family metallopeptidase [Limimaricola litoreus]MCP1170450.1 M23 family metallopeptidase [Limimaricola litoreus]